jgi:hypothetical protein
MEAISHIETVITIYIPKRHHIQKESNQSSRYIISITYNPSQIRTQFVQTENIKRKRYINVVYRKEWVRKVIYLYRYIVWRVSPMRDG